MQPSTNAGIKLVKAFIYQKATVGQVPSMKRLKAMVPLKWHRMYIALGTGRNIETPENSPVNSTAKHIIERAKAAPILAFKFA